MRPEVKMYTIHQPNTAITTENLVVPNASLLNRFQLGAANNDGMFSLITPGTGVDQRIGNKIRVKAITFHGTFWLCPAPDDNNPYNVVTVRFLAAATGSHYGGADITDYWSTNTTSHICDFPRRANYKTYLDKTFVLDSNTSITGPLRTGKGAMKTFKWNIKGLNKVIEYKSGQNSPKYSNDRWNFATFCFSPAVGNNIQLVCLNWVARIYYTDI